MISRWVWFVIAVDLIVLVALNFIYPHLMVSPGALSNGHASLTTDCFACHAPLRGASTERCIACHSPADIGLLTTKGVPIVLIPKEGTTPMKLSFHQELDEQDCMACHSDHAGPKLTQRSRKPFSHELLRVGKRDRCASCHSTPTDKMHRGITASCSQCHTTEAWKPATLDHDKLFLLDEDHNASCATCHVANDYNKYTCYGCHEHSVANIRGEHLEEGIRDFENCVECHRSAEDEPRDNRGGRLENRREGESGNRRGDHHDDDDDD